MLIDELANAGAMPTLEVAMRFAGQRQRLIAHNIANWSTPNFQPKDVSVRDFQKSLGEAIDARRARTGGTHGELAWDGNREVRRAAGGGLKLEPGTQAGSLLRHDRNSTDLERTLQDMVENASAFRVAADFLRQQQTQLRSAIAERVL